MTADLKGKISPNVQVSSDKNEKKNAKDEFVSDHVVVLKLLEEMRPTSGDDLLKHLLPKCSCSNCDF